jgi:hypothetical protein
MNKFELIEAIREFNPTATVEFLTPFDENELEEYLSHLREVCRRSSSLQPTPAVPYH